MAQRARGALRAFRCRVPALRHDARGAEGSLLPPHSLLGQRLLPGFDRSAHRRSARFVDRGERIDDQRPFDLEARVLRKGFAVSLGISAGVAQRIAVDPGNGALVALWAVCEQNDAGPIACSFTESRLDGVGDDVDEAVVEGFGIEDGLSGIASLEERSASSAQAIDGPREVTEEVRGPVGELAFVVS